MAIAAMSSTLQGHWEQVPPLIERRKVHSHHYVLRLLEYISYRQPHPDQGSLDLVRDYQEYLYELLGHLLRLESWRPACQAPISTKRAWIQESLVVLYGHVHRSDP